MKNATKKWLIVAGGLAACAALVFIIACLLYTSQGHGQLQGAVCLHAQLQGWKRRVQGYLFFLHKRGQDGV